MKKSVLFIIIAILLISSIVLYTYLDKANKEVNRLDAIISEHESEIVGLNESINLKEVELLNLIHEKDEKISKLTVSVENLSNQTDDIQLLHDEIDKLENQLNENEMTSSLHRELLRKLILRESLVKMYEDSSIIQDYEIDRLELYHLLTESSQFIFKIKGFFTFDNTTNTKLSEIIDKETYDEYFLIENYTLNDLENDLSSYYVQPLVEKIINEYVSNYDSENRTPIKLYNDQLFIVLGDYGSNDLGYTYLSNYIVNAVDVIGENQLNLSIMIPTVNLINYDDETQSYVSLDNYRDYYSVEYSSILIKLKKDG